MNETEKLRKIEREVIDEAYKKYAFAQYPEDIVIPFLLQIYGDTERHRNHLLQNGYSEVNVSTYLTNMMHGIGHCIRWVLLQKNDVQKTTIIDKSPESIQSMAADFLGWGTGYHMIVQEFTTWSRQIKSVVLDEDKKVITFVSPDGYDYSSVFAKQMLYRLQIDAEYERYPHDLMEQEFAEWMKDVDFANPPIANHVKWDRGRSSPCYPLLKTKMGEIIFPELAEETDFGGYSLGQLRHFFSLFYLNFYFIRWIEAVLDSKMPERALAFGSNPLYLSAEEFGLLAAKITGLEVSICKAIIDDLTFNVENLHASVSLQPFIVSSTGTFYILPNLFCQLEPSRMILGALNKGKKKKIYDKLINTIEKYYLNKLWKALSDFKGCITYLEKVIKISGVQIHPDLILIDQANRDVLIIDYKHFIGPITASEVDYRMKEMKKGISQVARYVELINQMQKIGLTDIKGFAVSGLIITHRPLPIPIPADSSIPEIDLLTFLLIVKKIVGSGGGGLSDLIQNIRTDGAFAKADSTAFDADISVGEWTVRRSLNRNPPDERK